MAPKTARDPCPHPGPPHPVRTPQPEDRGRGHWLEQESPVIEGCSPLWAPSRRWSGPQGRSHPLASSPDVEPSPCTERSPHADPSPHIVPTRSRPLVRSSPLVQMLRNSSPIGQDWMLVGLGEPVDPRAGLPCLRTQLRIYVCAPRAVGLILWESAAFSAPGTSLESEAAQVAAACPSSPAPRPVLPHCVGHLSQDARLTSPEPLLDHFSGNSNSLLKELKQVSITTNKASGGDGIPVELFQILKDDAVESAALNRQYAICTQYAICRLTAVRESGLETC